MQQGGGHRQPWSHHPRQALHRAREEGILGQQDRQASHRPHQGSHRAVARSVAEPKLFNLRSGSTLFSSGTSTVLPVPLKKYLVQTQTSDKSRVAGAPLFGWSLSSFFGPALYLHFCKYFRFVKTFFLASSTHTTLL